MSLLSLRLALTRGSQARSFPGLVRRQYLSLGGKGPWRCQSIFEYFPKLLESEHSITFQYTPSNGLAFEPEDLLHLCLLAAAIDPKEVVEIGTFRGRSALNLALNTKVDCRIHTFDLPAEKGARSSMMNATNSADARLIQLSQTGIEYRGKPAAEKIIQHYADSTKYDFSAFFDSCDLVFVDGAHHFEAARTDTENAIRMCKRGGYVVWDDWGNYGDYAEIVLAVREVIGLKDVVQFAGTQLAIYRKP